MIQNSKMILWTLAILIQMSVIRCLDVRAETTASLAEHLESRAVMSEQLTLYSDIYASREQTETPDEQYTNEAGVVYQLDSWEMLPIVRAEQKRTIERMICYPEVEGAARIPETIEVEVQDSGAAATVICRVNHHEVIKEHWEEGFVFPITYHRYDLGYYRLHDQVIPYNDEKPELGGSEALLLEMIGVSAADYRITDVQWTGEEYLNEAGESCRDAFAFGEKLVREVLVVYQGEAVIPEYYGWQVKAVYRPVPDEKPILLEPETEPLPVLIDMSAEPEPDIVESPALWQKIMNTLLISVAVGALLFFGGLLLLALVHLVKTMRTCYNKLHQKN